MNCYRFAHHSNVPATPPAEPLLDKAFTDDRLTRPEKDRLADMLYGVFSSHSPTFRLAGWAWPMDRARQIRRVLVRFRSDSAFHPYFAPDKTSLRRALRRAGSRPAEMIYA